MFEHNKILADIPLIERGPIAQFFRRVELKEKQVVHHSRLKMDAAYFVEKGVIAVGAKVGPGKWADVWFVGPEGMVGLPLVLGGLEAPALRRTVSVPGTALMIGRQDLATAVQLAPALGRRLLDFAQATLFQTAQLSACNAHHPLKGRLSRHLSFLAEAVNAPEIPLTHAAIARQLGVRRPSVSVALAKLEDEGAVKTHRGFIRIESRTRLAAGACECLRLIRSELGRSSLAPPDTASAEGISRQSNR
jgi:CRP-like cAMP-binding protein